MSEEQRLLAAALEDAHQVVRNAARILRAARKAAGLCIECERPALDGKSRCQKHGLMMATRAQRLRDSA